MNKLPNICPITKIERTDVDCITCCYLKQLYYGNIKFYCYADRVERGLPDYDI